MCWCINLSFTIIRNIFSRCCNDFVDYFYYGKLNAQDQYECSSLEADVICIINSDQFSKTTTPLNEERLFTRGIELESYFKAVNRTDAEQILINRVDGSFLVRPYKEKDSSIKYITTIYAKNNYFHLYIRKIDNEKFAMGLEKSREKYFRTPNEIINYYRLNKLQCTNKQLSICIVLIPIN